MPRGMGTHATCRIQAKQPLLLLPYPASTKASLDRAFVRVPRSIYRASTYAHFSAAVCRPPPYSFATRCYGEICSAFFFGLRLLDHWLCIASSSTQHVALFEGRYALTRCRCFLFVPTSCLQDRRALPLMSPLGRSQLLFGEDPRSAYAWSPELSLEICCRVQGHKRSDMRC